MNYPGMEFYNILSSDCVTKGFFVHLNRGRIFALTVLFSILIPFYGQAQHNDSISYLPEKIYLQLDSKVFTTDETILFKAIVVNADDHVPTNLSGVLYVELISPEEKVIEKKLIKLDEGIGNGFFDLRKDYSEGTYLIRAFTEWDKNFGDDFFFKEYIQVYSTSVKEKVEPINHVTLVEKENNERHLIAYFEPSLIDSLQKKELTLIISIDNKKDTITIEKNEDRRYMIEYSLPDECQFVTLHMLTKNHFSYFKTIVLDEHRVDLQFFPESGELVDGLKSKVGFKALNYNGKGVRVEGEIVNGKGEVVSIFKSNQLGMGSFMLSGVDKNSTFFARLKSQSDVKTSDNYPLPEIVSEGNVLSVIKNGDEIQLTASSSYLKNDSIKIRVSCRGLVYYDIKGPLKEGTLMLSLPTIWLPEGIIAFTMMDNRMHPVAERLYFNERPESRINIEILPDKDTCDQRELTRVNIQTTDIARVPVKANLSVLVINKEQMGRIQSMRQNILSYFLLNSDLRGEIENSGYYFNGGSDNYNDLDALLLTQGWRKYLYAKPRDTIRFNPETNLTVKGSVSGALFQKKKSAELTMMTFGHHRYAQTQKTDSTGRFNFSLNDEFGENLNILIQSANNAGEKKNYTITLDRKESPVVSFDHAISINQVDSVVKKLVEKNIERKKVEETYKLSGGILLGEVKVEAYKMTPNRKKVLLEIGKPNKVISGEEIQKKEEKWSFGLYSVIQARFPDINIHRYSGNNGAGFLWAQVRSAEPTLVVIDGITVKIDDYSLIPNIPPSEVSSFEIIQNARNFTKLFLEFYPEAGPLGAPANGDVIAIYTYGGNGILGAVKPVGIIHAAVPVFSAPREFYSPKYLNIQPDDWYKPDMRALIHWAPNIEVDSLGHASATFYNADITGEMEIVVEAISEDGKIGYQEFIYNVKKRDLKK
jgi:hypothetical protein